MEGYIGQILMFAGNFAPRGWAFCNGQLLSISSNSALFSILGTTYGGDGRTTFGLPDLRGRVAVAPGQGPGLSEYRLGQKGGQEGVTLTTTEMPAHSHSLNVVNSDGNTNSPANNTLAGFGTSAPPSGNWSTSAPNAMAAGTSIGGTGASAPHNNIQPFLAVQFIICTEGIYPSRG